MAVGMAVGISVETSSSSCNFRCIVILVVVVSSWLADAAAGGSVAVTVAVPAGSILPIIITTSMAPTNKREKVTSRWYMVLFFVMVWSVSGILFLKFLADKK